MGDEDGLVFSKGLRKCLLEKHRRVSVAAAGGAGLYFLALSPQLRKECKTLRCEILSARGLLLQPSLSEESCGFQTLFITKGCRHCGLMTSEMDFFSLQNAVLYTYDV